MTDIKTGITQQWRSVHFLSSAHKSWPVPPEGCELLAQRGDRKQAENWTSAVLYQTHTCVLALVLHMKKEQIEINEGWCHVNLTLCWRRLNKDLDTPKYCGAVQPSDYTDRRFRKSEKKGKGHAVPLLVSILSHHRTEICPRKFPSWWTWNSGDINTPFSSPIWGAGPRTFTVNSSLLRVQRLTGPDTTCTTLQPWLIKERKLDQWQEETGELLSRPSLPASFCWKREGLLGNLQVAET